MDLPSTTTPKLFASMPIHTTDMPKVMVIAINVTPRHLPNLPKKGPDRRGTMVLDTEYPTKMVLRVSGVGKGWGWGGVGGGEMGGWGARLGCASKK